MYVFFEVSRNTYNIFNQRLKNHITGFLVCYSVEQNNKQEYIGNKKAQVNFSKPKT